MSKITTVFIDWLSKPFTLIDRKRDAFTLILVTGVYGFLFMNVYNPFNMTALFKGGDWENGIIFLKFSLLAVTILFLMEFIVRPAIGLDRLVRGTFILFVLLELLIYSGVMYSAYELITNVSVNGFGDFIDIFRYSISVMAIPYMGMLFYFHHHQILSSITSMADHLIQIKDENNKLHLAINQDRLLTLVAADNYVTVYYEKEGNISKELVRTSLKKLETDLENTAIIRCSRSAMVNIKNIVSSKTESRQLILDIKNMPNEPMKVSRNYKARVLDILTNQ
ncbi:MAG: hypothetical protein ACJA2S_004087 [Cyclobacteriaceae bacterium]